MKRILAALLVFILLSGSAYAEALSSEMDIFLPGEDSNVEEAVDELAPFDLGAEDAEVESLPEELDGAELSDDGAMMVSAPAGEGETEGAEIAPEPAPEPEPTVISIKKNKTKKVYLGTKYRFEVTGKTVKSFTSSSKKIATVDKKTGVITLKKPGKVRITAKLKKKKKVVLTLKVIDPTVPTSVAINEGRTARISVNDTLSLSATVFPETAKQDVTWKSSNKKIATVDKDGNVTAIKTGKVKITAVTPNKKKAKLTLTVRRPTFTRSKPYMVAHALGGIGGMDYSNCLEAFQENYAMGHRIFEADFEYTSDGRMVLCHNWKRKMFKAHEPFTKTTYDVFMGSKIYDKYTPMDIDMLLLLMRDYPDIIICTDNKYTDQPTIKKQFTTLVNRAKALHVEDVLDRLHVEIYNKKMITTVKKIYPFPSYCYTLYKTFKKAPTNAQLENILAFCADNGIRMVSMKVEWWKPSYMKLYDKYGLEAGIYTTNDREYALQLIEQGVTAICTDFLPPIEG